MTQRRDRDRSRISQAATFFNVRIHVHACARRGAVDAAVVSGIAVTIPTF